MFPIVLIENLKKHHMGKAVSERRRKKRAHGRLVPAPPDGLGPQANRTTPLFPAAGPSPNDVGAASLEDDVREVLE